VPKPAADLPQLSIEEIGKLSGDAARGKEISTRCVMCHSIAGTGADFGPALDGWGQGKSPEVIATAIVRPNAEIANGYDGTEIKTKDGMTIQGILIKDGDPLMMRSMGGVTQVIPRRSPGRAAPADGGVADDQRGAARAHSPGCRRSWWRSARELITAGSSGALGV
jgi:putative heme-binding domain-containing protein